MPTKNNQHGAAYEHKKTVERSSSYPAYSMDYALELTKKIYVQFGSSAHNTRETIAKVLKMSANYLIIPLSTATQYGLLEMKSKIGYNPTPLFLRLYKPENEIEKIEAQLECIKNPKLYDALITAYKGNILPSQHALATTLFRRYNIAENASVKAAEVFIENLKSLSLLDEENKLIDLDQSEIPQSITPVVGDKQKEGHSENSTALPLPSSNPENLSMTIKLSEGRKSTLIYPDGITDTDWDKIIRVINAMKEE